MPKEDHASDSAQRFELDVPIHLQFPGEEFPVSARIGNISQEGLFAISDTTFPAGTEFNFRISDDDTRRSVTGRGRVAWRRQVAADSERPAGMGCRILRLTDASREALVARLSEDDAALNRAPPERRSLTQEMTRRSIDEELLKQTVERPEYFRTMGGHPKRSKPKKSLAFWLISLFALLALLAIAMAGLDAAGIIEFPTGLPVSPR